MTARRYTLAVLGWLALASASCGGSGDGDQNAPPPEPLVIESPHTRVLLGGDTVQVFDPTMFAYFSLDPATTQPSVGQVNLVRDFQTDVQSAQEPLGALGVRVEPVSELPVVLGLTPQANAAAGPQLRDSNYGYVFVDAYGHVLRVAGRMQSADMVCAAARTFGLTLDALQSASCR